MVSPGPDFIEMSGPRPNDENTTRYTAQADGTWKIVVTKAEAIAALNADFEAAGTRATAGWPEFEIQTWSIQAEEARQWTAAATADKPPTPFLTQLWTDRKALGWTEEFSALVARVISNNAAYVLATANLLAIRHSAERDINAVSEPASVTWAFP
jgi:hypothetical protein